MNQIRSTLRNIIKMSKVKHKKRILKAAREKQGRPHKTIRVMIVKMIQNLRNRMENKQETFNKDLEELKSKQIVMNNTITEIKNTLEAINSRIT